MVAPPDTKTKAANQAAMDKAKATANSVSNGSSNSTRTDRAPTNPGTGNKGNSGLGDGGQGNASTKTPGSEAPTKGPSGGPGTEVSQRVRQTLDKIRSNTPIRLGTVKDQSRIPAGSIKDITDRLPGMDGPTPPTPMKNNSLLPGTEFTKQKLNTIRRIGGWIPNPVDTPRPLTPSMSDLKSVKPLAEPDAAPVMGGMVAPVRNFAQPDMATRLKLNDLVSQMGTAPSAAETQPPSTEPPSTDGFMGFKLPNLAETDIYKDYTKANKAISVIGPENTKFLAKLFGGMGTGGAPSLGSGGQGNNFRTVSNDPSMTEPTSEVPIWLAQMLNMGAS